MPLDDAPDRSVSLAVDPAAGTRTTMARPAVGADFLGLRFEGDTIDQTIRSIADRYPGSCFAYIVTPNVDHVVRLHHLRSDLWPVYRQAWKTLCDSRILSLLARHAGVSLPTVPGSDLTEALLRGVIARNDRVAILGSTSAAVDALSKRFRLANVTHYDPPMGFIDDDAQAALAVEFLVQADARYSLLAVGSPQQEIIAYRTAKIGTATGIGLCVGASLDFLTGQQKRAPRFLQLLSLEWLHRLAAEPSRMWRRYLLDGPRIFAIYRAWRIRSA